MLQTTRFVRALQGWVGAASLVLGMSCVAQDRAVLPDGVTPEHYRIEVTPDPAALTFTGKVAIDITVHAPADAIVLNSADIVIDRAALASGPRVSAITYQEAPQTATFKLARKLSPGSYTLRLAYHGKIFRQASGLFALDYQTAGGSARALFTQFENSDARRFVPCWDEPARKATFELTATVPAGEMAVSNMPAASTESHGAVKTVHFAATPKMSSYLLFFAAGDFERVHRDVGGVDVGIVVKRGDAAAGQFALDTASQILPYYNDYFGTPYPLPKLDLIAGPGTSAFFSAMENWGAIFYFERDLLIDPRISAGEEPMADLMGLIPHVPADADPLVALGVVRTLVRIDRLFDGLPDQALFRSYAIGVLRPILARVGWTPKAHENDNEALLRTRLIDALSDLGDPAVITEARTRFAEYLANPAGTSADMRDTVLKVVALHADLKTWKQLHTLAQEAPTELERSELYTLLGTAEDPGLLRQALELALSGEPPATVAPGMIEAGAERHPDMTLDFAVAHWNQLSKYVEPARQPSFVPNLVFKASDPALIGKVDAFADKYIPADARQDVRKAVANVRYNAEVRAKRVPEAIAWIREK